MKRNAKQVLTELLVIEAQGGDDAAFARLYEVWAKDISRLARFMLRDSQAAEEVAQESWISIAKGLRGLDDPAVFCPWAFRVVRRRCADWIRKRKAERKKREALEVETALIDEGRREETPVGSALVESIQKMDTDSRLLIHLFYETGLSVAEVAHTLEVPVGTVKSRLFALREKLKTEIERKLK